MRSLQKTPTYSVLCRNPYTVTSIECGRDAQIRVKTEIGFYWRFRAEEGEGESRRGGHKMKNMTNWEWFCANCLRMIDFLNRHGRCPYCDSNAVDLAHRAHLVEKVQRKPKPEVVLSINL